MDAPKRVPSCGHSEDIIMTAPYVILLHVGTGCIRRHSFEMLNKNLENALINGANSELRCHVEPVRKPHDLVVLLTRGRTSVGFITA